MPDIEKHQRVNDIFLGPLERPALKWLAAHLPTWVTPNHCTVVGVLGAFFISISYILTNLDPNFLWFASVGFVINWFGDSLDGTLARFRHIERPVFGFFIDHTTDAFSQVVIFIGLGLSPFVSFNVAILALVGYLLLSVLAYVRTCVVGEFKISYGKLGPTEVRVLAILLNTAIFFFGVRTLTLSWASFQFSITPYDLVVGFIGLVLLWFFLSTAYRQARVLAAANQ
jgi:archaetidylinositol phosphate synthase